MSTPKPEPRRCMYCRSELAEGPETENGYCWSCYDQRELEEHRRSEAQDRDQTTPPPEPSA